MSSASWAVAGMYPVGDVKIFSAHGRRTAVFGGAARLRRQAGLAIVALLWTRWHLLLLLPLKLLRVLGW